MHSILQRVRELVGAGARTARCRPPITAAIDAEVGQLTAELVRIREHRSSTASHILVAAPFTLQVGANGNRTRGNQISLQPDARSASRAIGSAATRRDLRRSTPRSRASPTPAPTSARSRTGSSTPSTTSASTRRTSPPPRAASATSTSPRRWSTSPSCRSSRSPAPRCSPRPTRAPQNVLSLLTRLDRVSAPMAPTSQTRTARYERGPV